MAEKTDKAKAGDANRRIKKDAERIASHDTVLRDPQATAKEKAIAQSNINRDNVRQAKAIERKHFWSDTFKRAVLVDGTGRPKAIDSPEELKQAATDYFEYCEKNPIFEQKAFSVQGEVVDHPMEKPVPFTLQGFYSFAGITQSTFERLCELDEFRGMCSSIRNAITGQKVEGAIVGLFNATLTQRIEGISDKVESAATVTYEPRDFNDMYGDDGE